MMKSNVRERGEQFKLVWLRAAAGGLQARQKSSAAPRSASAVEGHLTYIYILHYVDY